MIYVTGGTGLVGSHLLYYLSRQGHKIKALKRSGSDSGRLERIFSHYDKNPAALLKNIEWVEGDVLDYFSLEDSISEGDRVYHCAAMVSFNPADHDQMIRVNVQGTGNLVNACLKKNIDKLCFVSSIASLGRASDGEAIDETVGWKTSRNNSVYAISKYNAEREVWRGTAEGLKAVIINPSVILGPGRWDQGSAQLFEQVWEGLKFYSNGINGLVDVRDVAQIMIKLMESNIHGERFIVNAESVSYRKLFKEIALNLGKKPPFIKVNPFITELAWRIEKLKFLITRKAPLITKETARTANAKYFYSSDKLIHALNYQFINSSKSIKDTAQVFLKDHQQQ
ncbi:MAG: NAD-dependent epimerase/dehydratase family protein [Bacteroidota bacterium]|nr:NAD-dependent epimerase/dehydratase family protein [Bacteroidota bacterium]